MPGHPIRLRHSSPRHHAIPSFVSATEIRVGNAHSEYRLESFVLYRINDLALRFPETQIINRRTSPWLARRFSCATSPGTQSLTTSISQRSLSVSETVAEASWLPTPT